MKEQEPLRIDKWLWTMRFFKTRSQASDACERQRVKINGSVCKASRIVKEGDLVELDLRTHVRTARIIKLSPSRIGAKLIAEFMEDLTPQEEYQKKESERYNRQPMYQIDEKPSKKSRRSLEDFLRKM